MANIDSIQAFADGKQRFGFLKNDYFLASGILYYKSTHWPVARWNLADHPETDPNVDIAYINTERRGQEDVATYVMQELQRRDIKCVTVTLDQINESST